MSALKLGLLTWCRRAVGGAFLPAPAASPAAAAPIATPSFADIAFEMALPRFTTFASVVELAHVLGEACAIPAGMAATGPTAQADAPIARHAASARPLALQLAMTAARTVRLGKKSRWFHGQVTGQVARQVAATGVGRTALNKRPGALKAKPATLVVVKKRAPKRRHVWLSTQSRVVRPIATNVVNLARIARTTTRTGQNKSTLRGLRLAA